MKKEREYCGFCPFLFVFFILGIPFLWTNEHQWSPLHVASLRGHVEVVKLLLAHPNINVNLKSNAEQTPLSFGCEYDQVSVVRVLLKDPRVDITMDDNSGCTPLWCASHNGNYKVIEWLIASGRDLGDIENTKGKSWNDGKDYSS